MNIFVGVLVGLLVLTFLVTAHELGHFIMARRNGVRVLEFGIGFPPKAIAWVRDPETKKWSRLPKSEWNKPQKGLIFSLNWVPIGGFCQMDGESAEDKRKGTFGNAKFSKKTKILFGGVLVNWLVSFVIFTVLAWTGMPQFLENQFNIPSDVEVVKAPVIVTKIAEGSPAQASGFMVGDKILAVDGNAMEYPSNITAYNSEHVGEDTTYTIIRTLKVCPEDKPECRDSEKVSESFEMKINVKLNPEGSKYLLGLAMESSQTLSYSTWSAPIVGAGLTLQMTGETFKGIGHILWNLVTGVGSQFSFDSGVRDAGRESISEVGESVSGPVGIIGTLFPTFTMAGPRNLAFFTAIISISLACMNVLPIPALDGGRWLLIAFFKLRKKSLTKELEEKIVSRAFLVLLALMLIITILDVIRLF